MNESPVPPVDRAARRREERRQQREKRREVVVVIEKNYSIITFFTESPRLVVEMITLTIPHKIPDKKLLYTIYDHPRGSDDLQVPGRETIPVANAHLGCHI